MQPGPINHPPLRMVTQRTNFSPTYIFLRHRLPPTWSSSAMVFLRHGLPPTQSLSDMGPLQHGPRRHGSLPPGRSRPPLPSASSSSQCGTAPTGKGMTGRLMDLWVNLHGRAGASEAHLYHGLRHGEQAMMGPRPHRHRSPSAPNRRWPCLRLGGYPHTRRHRPRQPDEKHHRRAFRP